MKSLLGHALVALVLFAVAFALWAGAGVQQSVATAHERMALLKYDSLDAAYDDIEQSMGYVRRVPWLASTLLTITNLDEQRAAADYWRARYASLRPEPAGGADRPPEIMALAANAAYRTNQRDATNDRTEVLKRLDAAVKSYGDLLKKRPGDEDAAYNYEYVIRMRDNVSKGRAPAAKKDTQKAPGLAMAGDLPSGRTIHGDPGARPAGVDASQFKLVIPKREDERGPGDKAGDGKLKVRKG